MKKLKNMKQSTLLLLMVAILLVAAVFTGYTHHRAGDMGTAIGKKNGEIVGTAIGSAKGITEGTQKGREDGAQEGLKAEDTIAEIKGAMEDMGKLEVLVAGVTLKNINRIGTAYAGLFLINGDAVFTVDMAAAEINRSQDGAELSIKVPRPELNVYLDMDSTQKLAEVQKFSLTVDAQDGLTAYLNSMTQTVKKVKDTMANYDSLCLEAENSANAQIRQLVKRICGNDTLVQVQFK